jgi:hypothetical protein
MDGMDIVTDGWNGYRRKVPVPYFNSTAVKHVSRKFIVMFVHSAILKLRTKLRGLSPLPPLVGEVGANFCG